MVNIASKNDIVIHEIGLRRDGDEEWTTLNFGDGNMAQTLGSFTISEGIFQVGLKGRIFLNDPDPDLNDRFSLADLAKAGSFIRFSFYTVDNNDRTHGINNLQFAIYNVAYISDLGPGVIKNNATSTSISYRLDFASYEGTSLDFETADFMENDFVGRTDEFVKKIINEKLSHENVYTTAQVPPQIEPTYNGMWIKNTQSLYPWGKEKSSGSLLSILNNCADFAIPSIGMEVDEDTGEIVNRGTPESNNPTFFFYQSMPQGQWNFRPIAGASGFGQKLNTSDGSDLTGVHYYQLTNDETEYNRASQFKITSMQDLLELQLDGALGAHYTLIEPNWEGIYSGISADCARKECEEVGEEDDDDCTSVDIITPKEQSDFFERINTYYHDAMSIGTHLRKEEMIYSYNDDFFQLTDSTDPESDKEYNGPLWGGRFMGFNENPKFSSIDDVIYGYFDNKYLNKPFPTEVDDYCSSRDQKYMWQTMFDLTDLPLYSNEFTGEIGIEEIVNRIRKPCKGGKIAYSILKDLKEQWNRYRHSICCVGSGRNKFTAMLIGFTGAGQTGAVNRSITPFALGASANTGLHGPTMDNFNRYAFVEVEVWPKELVPKGISASNFIEGADEELTYYEYLQDKDINPSNNQHQIYIQGYGGATGITFSFGLTASSSGQNYSINQEQEFFVIPVENGERGLFSAYNTNELTNNKAYTSAGINVKGYSYPTGFGLMPVGGMTVGLNDETTPLPATYMGTVVEMASLSEEELNTIKTASDAVGNSGGYTGPQGITTGLGDCNAVIGLLNTIIGTDNLPNTFCGSTLDITYKEITVEGGEEVITPRFFERDDKDKRNCILTNASPMKEVTEVAPDPTDEDPIVAPPIVYLFSVENDHDGRCT